jgi:hypothetical protein
MSSNNVKITGISTFRQYFENLSAQHIALKGSFYFGNVERILGGTRSDIAYPVLWLESPDIAFSERGNGTVAQFSCAFIIMSNTATDDYAAADAANFATHKIALDVLGYLQHFCDDDFFYSEIIDGAQLLPLTAFGIDNAVGWRCEFKILTPFNTCAIEPTNSAQFNFARLANTIPYYPANNDPVEPILDAINIAISGNRATKEITFSVQLWEVVTGINWHLSNTGGILASDGGNSLTYRFTSNTAMNTTIVCTRILMDGTTDSQSITFKPDTYL